MQKARRHERISLVADVTIDPGEEQSVRFASSMFNVSQGGAAVFSERHFPVGKLVRLKVALPLGRGRRREALLYGVIRHVAVNADGNVLGIQFVRDAADYEWFAGYVDRRAGTTAPARSGGFTLTEACIALVIICILVTMATPIYSRAIEQARVDGAAGNLRVIWAAQRIHWLANRTFANELDDLEDMDLVNKALAHSHHSPNAVFVYTITSASDTSFVAKAMRNGSGIWVGNLQIDADGEITGHIDGPGGVVITPPS